MPTRAGSQEQDVSKWSYFEKLERLKMKIIQTHQDVIILRDDKKPGSDTFKDFKIVDAASGVKNHQPPHPDWLSAKQSFAKSATVEAGAEVMSFEQYFK